MANSAAYIRYGKYSYEEIDPVLYESYMSNMVNSLSNSGLLVKNQLKNVEILVSRQNIDLGYLSEYTDCVKSLLDSQTQVITYAEALNTFSFSPYIESKLLLGLGYNFSLVTSIVSVVTTTLSTGNFDPDHVVAIGEIAAKMNEVYRSG